MLKTIFRNLIILVLSWAFLVNIQIVVPEVNSALADMASSTCRFGITAPHSSEGYDIGSLGVGSLLDWGAITNPSLPNGAEYIRVLRLRGDLYPDTLASLPGWLHDYPGSTWLVGNEPDTSYERQDGLHPEKYAEDYYVLATIIRRLDPTARIAFGTVVQPTPIRMRYLDRAWNWLVDKTGSVEEASKLIDIWSIHSFIENEAEYQWGSGIPPGFEDDHDDAVIITDFSNTYSIDIFKQRIMAFRQWMADKGERDKPLWITEYGSLFPPIDPPDGPDYVNVSEDISTNYMLSTFDFLMNAADEQIGMPADGDRLVQRWYWFSLNEHRYTFGGTVFDPDNGKLPTMVGEAFMDYQSNHIIQPDLYPANLAIAPKSYNQDRTRVNYRLEVTIGNNLFADGSCAQVWIYDGDPDNGGTLITGPIQASAIQSDYGSGKLVAYWMNVQPFVFHNLSIRVEPVGVEDINPGNNQANFLVYTKLPRLNYLPEIHRYVGGK